MVEPQTLSDLSQKIKSIISDTFPFSMPVIAEISELNINKNGNCYLELIEQDADKSRIIARVRGIIFSNRLQLIQSYFLSATGHPVQVGIKVLVMVRVSYHELYGLSVEIVDIDPKYTLGDLEQQKKLIIERLAYEGVIEMNKSLPLPVIIKKIAVISSSTAAGYGDFIDHLKLNQFGYKFNIKLFESFMQGQQTIESISTAIDLIFSDETVFDIIVIIRGGGSKMELAVFDNYDLSYLITQLPIPVFTGIGHDRDESVLDIVANNALKTPTAVANFIIDYNNNLEAYVNSLNNRLLKSFNNYLSKEKEYTGKLGRELIYSINNLYSDETEYIFQLENKLTQKSLGCIIKNKNTLNNLKSKLQYSSAVYFTSGHHHFQSIKNNLSFKLKNLFLKQTSLLANYQQIISYSDPQNILNKGYAIVTKNGERIMDSQSLQNGDLVQITLNKGKVKADVREIMIQS